MIGATVAALIFCLIIAKKYSKKSKKEAEDFAIQSIISAVVADLLLIIISFPQIRNFCSNIGVPIEQIDIFREACFFGVELFGFSAIGAFLASRKKENIGINKEKEKK